MICVNNLMLTCDDTYIYSILQNQVSSITSFSKTTSTNLSGNN